MIGLDTARTEPLGQSYPMLRPGAFGQARASLSDGARAVPYSLGNDLWMPGVSGRSLDERPDCPSSPRQDRSGPPGLRHRARHLAVQALRRLIATLLRRLFCSGGDPAADVIAVEPNLIGPRKPGGVCRSAAGQKLPRHLGLQGGALGDLKDQVCHEFQRRITLGPCVVQQVARDMRDRNGKGKGHEP